jgi:hypothetical protein
MFSQLWHRLNTMPSTLRVIVIACLGIGVSAVACTFVPGARVNLWGTQVPWHELWPSRIAFALIGVGGLMVWTGLAVLLRKAWARIILVIMPILVALPFVLVNVAFGGPKPTASASEYVLGCVTWGVIAALYLFHTSGVRKYFEDAV